MKRCLTAILLIIAESSSVLLLGWLLIGTQILVPLLIAYLIFFVIGIITEILKALIEKVDIQWLSTIAFWFSILLNIAVLIGAGWYLYANYGWKGALIFAAMRFIARILIKFMDD